MVVTASKAQLARFDQIQANALRHIIGAPYSTPHILLQADTMCSSLAARRKMSLVKNLFRIQTLPQTASLHKRLQEHNSAKNPSDKSFFSMAKTAQKELELKQAECTPQHKPLNIAPWKTSHYTTPDIAKTEKEKFKRLVLEKTRHQQNQEYINHAKTEHYRRFRPNTLDPWSHSDIKTHLHSKIIFRLRSGHSKLAMHDRTLPNQHPKLCACGSPETTDHVLLTCTRHALAREELFKEVKTLLRINTQPTINQLLGMTPKINFRTQQQVFNEVAKFVKTAQLKV